jgi:hypothetical membrane protein
MIAKREKTVLYSMLRRLYLYPMKMPDTLPAVLFFMGVILLAHFFAPPGYGWMNNTISDLGSQGHIYKWIMQAGFIGFGLLLTGGLVHKFRVLGQIQIPGLLVMLYGLSVLMTGFFCAAPIDNNLAFSVIEAQTHSIFATLAGFALVAGILGYMLTSPSRWMFHLVFVVLIVAISALFGFSENGTIAIGKGIIQRTLYLVSFVWLVLM